MNKAKSKNVNTNNHYSAEIFFNQIIGSNFYQEFIKPFDKDNRHYNLVARKSQIIVRRDIFHFFSFIFNTTYICVTAKDSLLSNNDTFKCVFCNYDTNDEINYENNQLKWSYFLYLLKKEFISFLNSFFEVDFVLAQVVLTRIKNTIYTKNGTTGLDMNQFIYDEIKRINRIDVSYRGLMYSIIKEDTLYMLCTNILFDLVNNFKKIFIIPYSVNTISNPQHWCVIIVDFTNHCLFFYNSLAKSKQTPKLIMNRMVDFFSNSIKQDLQIHVNTARQQGSSKLCGLFVINFISKMVFEDNDKRVSLFYNTFNKKGKIDEMIYLEQKKYIYELIDCKNSLNTKNTLNGFFNCKKIFQIK
jgi:hypothetical protein